MRIRNWFAIPILALLPVGLSGQNQQGPAVITVDAAHPGAAISSQMFGIFFEDINFGADGGLYPELVKNRSFEFSEPLAGWHEIMGVNEKGLDSPRANWRHPHRRSAERHQSALSAGRASMNQAMASITPAFAAWALKSGAEYRFSAYRAQQRTKGDPRHAHGWERCTKSAAASWKDSAANGSDTKP